MTTKYWKMSKPKLKKAKKKKKMGYYRSEKPVNKTRYDVLTRRGKAEIGIWKQDKRGIWQLKRTIIAKG